MSDTPRHPLPTRPRTYWVAQLGSEIRSFHGTDAEAQAVTQVRSWGSMDAYAWSCTLGDAIVAGGTLETWSLTQRTLLAARLTVAALGAQQPLVMIALALLDEAAAVVADHESRASGERHDSRTHRP